MVGTRAIPGTRKIDFGDFVDDQEVRGIPPTGDVAFSRRSSRSCLSTRFGGNRKDDVRGIAASLTPDELQPLVRHRTNYSPWFVSCIPVTDICFLNCWRLEAQNVRS